jgi:enoyl-CoA hydratase/carnithine racemase
MVALSRNVPRKAAFEMLTTGRFVDAAEAQAMGLVNRVVPPDRLEAETAALARTVADKLAAAVKVGKQAFYRQIEMPVDEAYAYAGATMVENMLWRDTDEGIRAFLEKRPPDWQRPD